MPAPHVIAIEDDWELRSLLERGLREEGFRVTATATAAELFRALGDGTADALVVDVGLPDADGRDIVQALRAGGFDAPVIFLTARDALPDRLAGFAAGGDDYLTKPFAFAELVARLRALLKRGIADVTVGTAGLRLDPGTYEVSCGDAAVALTPTEFRLLATLATAAGDAVSRRDLVRAGWPHGAIVRDNTLDVYIARLRRKLAGISETATIGTTHGIGYSLR